LPGPANSIKTHLTAQPLTLKNLEYDKKTGEILNTGKVLYINESKIAEEEKYDGYYSIVTSELGMSVADIIDTYRGLWEIEETFKITKSDLETRPVYVSEYSHINAHFFNMLCSANHSQADTAKN
jgi:transposase